MSQENYFYDRVYTFIYYKPMPVVLSWVDGIVLCLLLFEIKWIFDRYFFLENGDVEMKGRINEWANRTT